jgi:hypothetical protein
VQPVLAKAEVIILPHLKIVKRELAAAVRVIAV